MSVDDVAQLLAEADVYVRPSLTDGMSLALLEAMASGLPIVASASAGTTELLADGRCGVIVEPGSVQSLADGIRSLLADGERARAIGRAARQRALSLLVGPHRRSYGRGVPPCLRLAARPSDGQASHG